MGNHGTRRYWWAIRRRRWDYWRTCYTQGTFSIWCYYGNELTLPNFRIKRIKRIWSTFIDLKSGFVLKTERRPIKFWINSWSWSMGPLMETIGQLMNANTKTTSLRLICHSDTSKHRISIAINMIIQRIGQNCYPILDIFLSKCRIWLYSENNEIGSIFTRTQEPKISESSVHPFLYIL